LQIMFETSYGHGRIRRMVSLNTDVSVFAVV
jgi:hypothetical protein